MSGSHNDDNVPPGQGTPGRPMEPLPQKKLRIGMMIIGGLLALSILAPYFFWRGTWFGRQLSDEQMAAYLKDDGQPRHIQHALVQISDRIIAGNPSVERWYPEVIALSDHPQTEVRTTVAWVMGQDNESEEFRATLVMMLDDTQPIVRRNAALSLVRFNDRSGRPVILEMLQAFTYRSPREGKLIRRLELDDSVSPGTLLARVETGANEPEELRSPLSGTVREWLAEDGSSVVEGQELLVLSPSPDQAWEALRALFLIGERGDLTAINRIAGGAYDMPQNIRQQAILTAAAIQQRMVEESNRKAEED